MTTLLKTFKMKITTNCSNKTNGNPTQIECTMFEHKGTSSKWSTEAINDFESLTHSGKWKPLLAKIVNFDKGALRLEFQFPISNLGTKNCNERQSNPWKQVEKCSKEKSVQRRKVMVNKKHQTKMRRFTYLDANQFRIDYGDNIVQRFSEVSVF